MDTDKHDPSAGPRLKATPDQIKDFKRALGHKPYRDRLSILVVEDQLFSQKLLCDILRDTPARKVNAMPIIAAAQSVQDAWNLFLKKAPDLTFIDLGLTDGSGHMLAATIKAHDPHSWVVIVTANTYAEDIAAARANRVDGFIMKPYNKKQIVDCVDRYLGIQKAAGKIRRSMTSR